MELKKTIALRVPVDIGDATYERLEMREPTAGELEAAVNAATPTGQTIELVASIAGIPREAVERIGMRDLLAANSFIDSFRSAVAAEEGAEEAPEAKTVLLRQPVNLGGVVYERLELREPLASEYRESERARNRIGQVISLASLTSKTPLAAIRRLCMRDFNEVNAFFDQVLLDSLPVGETSSPS